MDATELFLEVARLAGLHGFKEDLYWDQDLAVSVDVSDLFYWACADSEDVTEENLPLLKQSIEDIANICKRSVHKYATPLFAARVRGQRPQGKYISDYVYEYPDRVKVYDEEFQQWVWQTPRDADDKLYHDPQLTQALKALFLALPERPVDFGNPFTPEGSYDYGNAEA
ncbi:MAG: hypothetical protein A4E20_10960 [Nitrospira sp. SG-bin2]|uniref:hypothetical protein n=1 Tax=Nitrospira cf. moscoviensis SBR1015 TaxID=96242 RepID=UPI000A0D8E8F|nr:hypothetical protein [Nitrospira cf. moscoviensis SBR1015]OQW34532.1 MAG: hypothetical protein A4E20_10960 [Nitrospira sp. SG-bin2]